MDEGVCPANIYKDNDGNDQVCFDNAGECMTQSKFKDHEENLYSAAYGYQRSPSA